MPGKLIKLGTITGAHGIKGEVVIKPFGQDPLALNDYGPLKDESGSKTYTIKSLRLSKKTVIASIEEITDRDEAEANRGIILCTNRDNLPEPEEDEFYYSDLIGLEVRSENGEPFGKIKSIDNHGAGDIIEIMPQNSQATMHILFTQENVPEVNIKEGFLIVIPPSFDKNETSE